MAIDKVKYWKELADYDIETAEVMYNGGRWLYVGFMCHLVIEKNHKIVLECNKTRRGSLHP